jgi:hypothetical protein
MQQLIMLPTSFLLGCGFPAFLIGFYSNSIRIWESRLRSWSLSFVGSGSSVFWFTKMGRYALPFCWVLCLLTLLSDNLWLSACNIIPTCTAFVYGAFFYINSSVALIATFLAEINSSILDRILLKLCSSILDRRLYWFWYFRHAAVNSVANFISSRLWISSFPDWILFNQDMGIPP